MATVTFEVHPSRLAFNDEAMRFAAEPGTFRVSVGGSSDTSKQHATVDLTGDVAGYRQRGIVATTVSVEHRPER